MSAERRDPKNEVRRQAGDPDVYARRLRYRGGKNVTKRIKASITEAGWRSDWVKLNGKWQKMDVRNSVHRATAAVGDGTIKALTTDAVPANPSLSWWYTVDKNALRDAQRKENNERAVRGALTAATIIEERNTLPARRAHGGHEHDPYADNDERTDRLEPRIYAKPKYVPTPEGPHPRVPGPDENLDAVLEDEAETKRTLAARKRLEDLRCAARLTSEQFELLRRHLADKASWRTLAEECRPKVDHKKIGRQLTAAIDALLSESGMAPGRLAAEFTTAYPPAPDAGRPKKQTPNV
jgi:hypothetical protein